MIAVIQNEDSQYLSFIVAILNKKSFFDEEIIVFDPSFTYLKKIPLYQHIKEKGQKLLIRQAIIIDFDDDEFVKIKGQWTGYDFLIHNKETWNRLLKGELVAVNSIDEIEKYKKQPIIPKWFNITDNKSIKNLMYISKGFHDAILEEVIENNGDVLELQFETFDGDLYIRFENVIDNQLEGKIGELLDTELVKVDDFYLWKINDGFGGWDDGIDYDISSKGAFIKCKKIQWKFEIKF